jgi:HSP90 family molecular chaperone
VLCSSLISAFSQSPSLLLRRTSSSSTWAQKLAKSTSKRQPSSSAFTWESNWEHELIQEIFVFVGKDICRYLDRSFSLNMKWQGNTEMRTTLPLRAGSES